MQAQRNPEKSSILHYLPEAERAKLMKLIERLAEETAEKQKYQGLYQQMQQKNQQLIKKYEELEQYTLQLKSQIATSRMAINKAKQVYIASKSAQKDKKKGKNKIQDISDEEWEVVDPSDKHEQKNTKISSPKKKYSSEIERIPGLQSSRSRQYLFEEPNPSRKRASQRASRNDEEESEESEQIGEKINFKNIQEHQQRKKPPLPHHTDNESAFKSNHKSKYSSSSKYGSGDLPSIMVCSGTKKDEIMNLRKQIQSLTENMQKKNRSQIPYAQKMKKCEEIKKKFMKNQYEKKQDSSIKASNKNYSAVSDSLSSESESEQEVVTKHKQKNGGQKLAENIDNENKMQQRSIYKSKLDTKNEEKRSRDRQHPNQSSQMAKTVNKKEKNHHATKPHKGDERKQQGRVSYEEESLYDVIAALNA